MSAIDDLIDEILQLEGGFVNHTADRGSATNFGITQGTLAAHRGHAVTVDDVIALTVDEARTIYRTRYVEAPGFETLPEPIRTEVVDHGVLSGPGAAVRDLQRALGVPVDGILGPVTRAAVDGQDLTALALAYMRERILRLARIVSGDPSQNVFLIGWMRRALKTIDRISS